jgi:hypothetical protein
MCISNEIEASEACCSSPTVAGLLQPMSFFAGMAVLAGGAVSMQLFSVSAMKKCIGSVL